MLTGVDVALIAAYLLAAFGVGLAMSKRAGTGLDSYFVADRSLPWWWLGTSMVATTFASDTPLVVTGFVADYGIAGNWFWWSVAVGLVLLAVVFAPGWRASGVLTDAELIELRYSGRPAAFLRAFKAVLSSLVVNCIVLGWVFAAMAKITRPFIQWQSILGPARFAELEATWPAALTFQSLDNTLTIVVLLVVVVVYSSAGGIRGVILTDLLQFAIALGSAVAFAWLAVDHVGGLEGLWTRLEETYPSGPGARGPTAEGLRAFWPDWQSGATMSFGVFATSIGVLWWANSQVDASGYLAQRLNTARSRKDAEYGALWFCFANFVLRTWPWVLVALVALVVFPLDDPTRITPLGAELEGDREMGYPVLMKLVLPPGLLGLVLLSLIAAFMSTVDTHINWGASYPVNDLYKRFARPSATDAELVLVSRCSVVMLSIIAVLIAAQIDQVGDMWKFCFALLSGLGVPHMLRWLWWRANAWTEIAGMTTGLLLAVPTYGLGWAEGLPAEYVIGVIAGVSAVAALSATLATPAEPEDVLSEFARRVRPVGVWKGRSEAGPRQLRARLTAWLSGVTSLFCLLFGVGALLRLEPLLGSLLLGVGTLAAWLTTMRLRLA